MRWIVCRDRILAIRMDMGILQNIAFPYWAAMQDSDLINTPYELRQACVLGLRRSVPAERNGGFSRSQQKVLHELCDEEAREGSRQIGTVRVKES